MDGIDVFWHEDVLRHDTGEGVFDEHPQDWLEVPELHPENGERVRNMRGILQRGPLADRMRWHDGRHATVEELVSRPRRRLRGGAASARAPGAASTAAARAWRPAPGRPSWPPRARPSRPPTPCSTGRARAPTRSCARRATTPRSAPPTATASSTTRRWRRSARASAAWSAWRSWTGTCTTATAPRRSSSTAPTCSPCRSTCATARGGARTPRPAPPTRSARAPARASTSTWSCRSARATAATRRRWDRVAGPLVEAFEPELVIIASGQDANQFDPNGRQSLDLDGFRALGERARVLADRFGGRLLMIQEGGYSRTYSALCLHASLEGVLGHGQAAGRPHRLPPGRAGAGRRRDRDHARQPGALLADAGLDLAAHQQPRAEVELVEGSAARRAARARPRSRGRRAARPRRARWPPGRSGPRRGAPRARPRRGRRPAGASGRGRSRRRSPRGSAPGPWRRRAPRRAPPARAVGAERRGLRGRTVARARTAGSTPRPTGRPPRGARPGAARASRPAGSRQ